MIIGHNKGVKMIHHYINKIYLKFILLTFIFLNFTSMANAFTSPGIVFSPMIGYYNYNDDYKNTTASPAQDQRSHFLYDIRMGYLFNTKLKFYLGLIYSAMKRDYTPGTIQRISAGASAGFAANNFAIMVHFFPWSEYNSPNFRASDGVGFQLDAGYYAPLSKAFSLGMQFTYRNITYNTYTPVGSTTGQSKVITEEEYLPMIGCAIIF